LEAQNGTVHTALQIKQVSWLRGENNSRNAYSLLIELLESQEATNKVIKKWFVKGAQSGSYCSIIGKTSKLRKEEKTEMRAKL
jgi:hypothetical protein